MEQTEITIHEIENSDILETICEEYSKGDDTVYPILDNEGNVKAYMKPYDGPYTETLIEDGEDYVLPLPDRLINKLGLSVGDDIDIDVKDGTIFLSKKDDTEEET